MVYRWRAVGPDPATFTVMGQPVVLADRPADLVARTLFEAGGVESVHVNGNVITVSVSGGSSGLKERLEELFIYYREGVEVVMPEGFGD